MTNTATAGATSPGRPGPAGMDSLLFVDLDKIRARYECYRPGCAQRLEGPVYGDDVAPFAAVIRNDHRARCTGESR